MTKAPDGVQSIMCITRNYDVKKIELVKCYSKKRKLMKALTRKA